MPEWKCKDDFDEFLRETSGEPWEEWPDDEIDDEVLGQPGGGGETWEEWPDDEVLGQPGGGGKTWEEWQDDDVSETGEAWEEEQDDQVLGQPGGKQVLGQPGGKTWEDEREETIRKTQELLDRLCRRPPPWRRGRSPQRQEPPHPPSKKIKTGMSRSDKAYLELCKVRIWPGGVHPGRRPRATLLTVVLQRDFQLWKINGGTGAKTRQWESGFVRPIFAVDCF